MDQFKERIKLYDMMSDPTLCERKAFLAKMMEPFIEVMEKTSVNDVVSVEMFFNDMTLI